MNAPLLLNTEEVIPQIIRHKALKTNLLKDSNYSSAFFLS
jgi:hypothetical protein